MMRETVLSAVRSAAVLAAVPVLSTFGGPIDNAWLKCTTNKNPLEYKPDEEMVFTLAPQDIEGQIPEGEYFLEWKRTDDFGGIAKYAKVIHTSLEETACVNVTEDGLYEIHALTDGAAEGLLGGGMQQKVADLFGEPFIYEVVEEGEVQ